MSQPAYRKKLIEVDLPLDEINRESAREKSIRHGHPSTLHLWWARRPLAACRAVIFASMVDDPSSCPDEFPDEESQRVERERLHDLIRELVKWESTDERRPDARELIATARYEIARSIARSRGETAPTEPAAVLAYLNDKALAAHLRPVRRRRLHTARSPAARDARHSVRPQPRCRPHKQGADRVAA